MSRRILVLLVAALLLLLAGCSVGSDPAAVADPTPSTSATPVVESSSPPVAETPEAFIRRWLAVSVTMQSTGDTTEFAEVSRGCAPCADLIDTVSAYYADGGFVMAAPIDVVAISRTGESNFFLVTTTSGETRYRTSSSDAEKRLKGGPVTYRVQLAGSKGSWRMKNYFVKAQT